MNLAHYLGLLHRSELELAAAYREVGSAHADEPDVDHTCRRLASQCDGHARVLFPFAQSYGEAAEDEPERLHSELFRGARSGGLGLLRDLHDLYLMATEADLCWQVVGQAAKGARDDDLDRVVAACASEATIQLAWLRSRIEQAAPQALVVG